MATITLQDLLGPTPPPPDSVLEGDAVQRAYWRIKGAARELERERSFWKSTNETLSRAYDELRQARDRIAEQQEAIHKLVAAEKARLERELKLAARIQTSILRPRSAGTTTTCCRSPAGRGSGSATSPGTGSARAS
jgi:hypothetical protein